MEYLGHIRSFVGDKRQEEVEIKKNSSVATLLLLLGEKHGESFRKSVYAPENSDVKSDYIVTVNGYLLNQLSGIHTKLNEGDNVKILPIVSGG